MTFAEYQEKSKRTLNPNCGPRDDNYILGLIGETGELTDMIKKHVWHDHDLDNNKVKLELGDILFYAAAVATQHGITLNPEIPECNPGMLPGHLCRTLAYFVATIDCAVTSMPELVKGQIDMLIITVARLGKLYGFSLHDIMTANLTKLQARYPQGFSEIDSKNRVN